MSRVIALLMIAAMCVAAGGEALAEQRVHPTAQPARPAPTERVVIRFRTRETLDGVYVAEARRRPRQAGCGARRSRILRAPERGAVVRLSLRPPPWCTGTYRATVFFKQTVRCIPSVQCGGSVEVPLGSTTFTVSR